MIHLIAEVPVHILLRLALCPCDYIGLNTGQFFIDIFKRGLVTVVDAAPTRSNLQLCVRPDVWMAQPFQRLDSCISVDFDQYM